MNSSNSVRLRKIDALTSGDHHFIRPDYECYYLMEFTPGGKHSESSKANSFINNLKKPPDREGRPEWEYKKRDMHRAVKMLETCLDGFINYQTTSLIPIPPSKPRTDPLYDGWMLEILNRVASSIPGSDVRDLFVVKDDIGASHASGNNRPTTEQLYNNYSIDDRFKEGLRNKIILFDDVVTSGAHFVTCRKIIQEINPSIEVGGVFLARRVPDLPTTLEDFSDLF